MTDPSPPGELPSERIVRLSGGSYGGKGEGILRIDTVIAGSGLGGLFEDLAIAMPKTLLIGTDSFDSFLESNGIREAALASRDYAGLRRMFVTKPLPHALETSLDGFLSDEGSPLIVRSSSLLEDSVDLPFSGVYESYVIPNSHPDRTKRLGQLLDAIRLVYASLFSDDAVAYRDAVGCVHADEKMAVVIQELVGTKRASWFYPRLSGTAQSYNYYPVSYAKPEDGLCVAALGLGAWVVDGGASFRFCPKYPQMNATSPDLAGEGSQYRFLALASGRPEPDFLSGQNAALEELELSEAEGSGVLDYIVSTWDRDDCRLVPGTTSSGSRILDLAPILKYQALPLASAISAVLDAFTAEEGGPVEIEYAQDRDPGTGAETLFLLQVKPLHSASVGSTTEISDDMAGSGFIYSDKSMGHGTKDGITDIIWLDPARFNRAETIPMASELTEFNRSAGELGRHYLLIGPGRFGSRDPWLGVPVTFSNIAWARVIVETEIPGFSVDFSFGSHFLHNITGTNAGYMAIPSGGPSFVDWDWLRGLPRERTGKNAVWSKVERPLTIVMDGKNGRAVVGKP